MNLISMHKRQKGFLKCFYGYHNRGDEVLFWGVIDYIDQHYTTLDNLDVEVEDVAWMQTWRDRHLSSMTEHELALGFVSDRKKIHFVPRSKDISDNFSYDIYFFGGGELFAQSRGFHGGWNYLLRYLFALNTKPYILLGGFEKATTRWQKLLYQFLLSRAETIICRDQISHQTVSSYVDCKEKIILHEDFAVKVIKSLSLSHSLNLTFSALSADRSESPYALVNLIEHRLDSLAQSLVQQRYRNYTVNTKAYIIYFPCTDRDRQWQAILTSRAIPSEMYDWTEHTIEESLGLFAHADAVVGSRLHFLLPAQILDRPRLAISYAEKIQKLITSTIEVQN